jgi:DNA-binding NarL/FixJ family response regulator
MSRKETGVLVAIAHRAMRDTVCSKIDGSSGLRVPAATSSKADVPRLVERVKPVVVLVEHPLAGEPMLEAVAAIHARFGTPSVLMCLLAADDLDAAFETRGVADVVLSDRPITHLIAVLRRDLHDFGYSADGRPRDATGASSIDRLTPREKVVLGLVVHGRNSSQIAKALDVRVRTVRNHRANILRKLELHNTTELVRYVLELGLDETLGAHALPDSIKKN